jgi:hypothetical protein
MAGEVPRAVAEGQGKTCSFLKKRTKKLLLLRSGPQGRFQRRLARRQTEKSFLVLFSKKNILPSLALLLRFLVRPCYDYGQGADA